MAKKIYPITKFRFVAIVISALLLLVGLISYIAFGGFNLGLDFQSGFSQRVQIAPSALSLSYSGGDTVTVNVIGGDLSFIIRDSSGATYTDFKASDYRTIGDLVDAIQASIAGVQVVAFDRSLLTAGLITGFGLPAQLSTTPFILNAENRNMTSFISIDDMRDAMGSDVQVQIVGDAYKQIFQLRLANDDNLAEEELSAKVQGLLRDAFGRDAIVVLQTDFVGPKYSSTLISGSILIVIVAIALILLYIWFRFKIAYALAAIITLMHDAFVLLGFIALFRLEVSSTTIAALLTIIGYSLNNVIVIFDRIRENRPLLKDASLMTIIDTSVSQSLTRTIFSSMTTIFAILPLAILASGAIQLFAIEMVFGIIVGAYSCNFLAPSLFLWISKDKGKKQPALSIEPEGVIQQETSEQKKTSSSDVEIPLAQRKLKGKRQQKK